MDNVIQTANFSLQLAIVEVVTEMKMTVVTSAMEYSKPLN
jgi:hypothetical protein